MERALVHFPGAVIVVSHDRFFIDNVVTRLLVFEGDGRALAVNANGILWQANRDTGAGGAVSPAPGASGRRVAETTRT